MKIGKPAYTTEFKELTVKRVKNGRSSSTVTKELGLGDQTLRKGDKTSAEGKLRGIGNREVTPEEKEFSGLQAENLRHKWEMKFKKSDRPLCKRCSVRYPIAGTTHRLTVARSVPAAHSF